MGTFGDTLRSAREDLDASLVDVERETRINRRYLAALEREDESALPAAVYTRGFIRTYCQYLGLNPEGMLDLFGPRHVLEQKVDVRPIPAEIASTPSLPMRPVVALAAIVMAALLTTYLWSQYTSFVESVGRLDTVPSARSTSAPPTFPPRPTSGPSSTPGLAGVPVLAPLASPSPSPSPSNRGLVVEAEIVDRTWLEVWVDGKSVFADTVQPGTSRTFTAEQQVRLRVGNAAGAKVVVNGTAQGPLGARGQAVDASWGRQ
ncbi:MAG: DUF4115 domain-containing protein [Chloroflexi bacterium]|nr:DUF4115 domain-containing protein [Chloroflexota bacterium]